MNQQVADHYSEIEVLSGAQIAYDALMTYLAEQGEPLAAPSASPMGPLTCEPPTPQQRFFVSAASVWRVETRDEALRTQVMIDVPSPARVRAVVPIQHMDEFYEAFDIWPGDPMYLPPEERIVIW